MPLANAGDQVPPASGVPPKTVNKSTGVLVVHKSIVPLVPASGNGLTVTVTEADASGQGATPATIYVYTPAGSNAGLKIPLPPESGGTQTPPKSGWPFVSGLGPN